MKIKCEDCKNTDKEVLYCWDCLQLNIESTKQPEQDGYTTLYESGEK